MLMILGASCTSDGMRQELVDEMYPPDCQRIEIREAFGEPWKSGSVLDPKREGFAAWAIRDLEANSGAVVASWDVYLRLRGWFGLGLYGDYLFYTKDDVLIQARRRFLD